MDNKRIQREQSLDGLIYRQLFLDHKELEAVRDCVFDAFSDAERRSSYGVNIGLILQDYERYEVG